VCAVPQSLNIANNFFDTDAFGRQVIARGRVGLGGVGVCKMGTAGWGVADGRLRLSRLQDEDRRARV
jgi:hypothetical protein